MWTERTLAPAETLVSLTQVKDQLRIDGTDNDIFLNRLIAAATSVIDGKGVVGRALVNQNWTDFLEAPKVDCVPLLMATGTALVGVKYYDADGVLQDVTANFELIRLGPDCSGVRPKMGFAWPSSYADRADAFQIEYTAGYGAASDVPADLVQAVLMLVAFWFENRTVAEDRNKINVPFGFDHLVGLHRRAWYG